MTACDRYGHAWYTRRFGGIGCGRCGERRSRFCMVAGRPIPYDELGPIETEGAGA